MSRQWKLDPLEEVVRAKSIHRFKPISLSENVLVHRHLDLIQFKTTLTSHANIHFVWGGCKLKIQDISEQTKGCWPIGLSSTYV